jgi:phosphonate transport system ATP-binding protein
MRGPRTARAVVTGRGERRAVPGPPLQIQELRKSYTADRPVLRGVSLELEPEGITIVIGPSGAGKSTLLRCINRLVEPTSGRILFKGTDLVALRGQALRACRRRIGMVFQEFNLVERLSVIENLLSGRLGYVHPWRAWLRKFPEADIRKAFDLLEQLGLGEFAAKRADALSGGQRQRVGIGRALMQGPELLLADEPTSSLDPKTSVEIMETMAGLARERHIPVIVNMHDVHLARRFADRVVGMTDGRIVFAGRPSDLTEGDLSRIYGGEAWMH